MGFYKNVGADIPPFPGECDSNVFNVDPIAGQLYKVTQKMKDNIVNMTINGVRNEVLKRCESVSEVMSLPQEYVYKKVGSGVEICDYCMFMNTSMCIRMICANNICMDFEVAKKLIDGDEISAETFGDSKNSH